MVLPSSGAITFAQIATELGRTGTSVSLNQADVAALAGKSTGAAITVPNDFWGKTTSDPTINPVSWGSITNNLWLFGSNSPQTISGINVPITLRATITEVQIDANISAGSVRFVKNSGPMTVIGRSVNDFGDLTVSNGDTVHFYADFAEGIPTAMATYRATVTVRNLTDGNVQIGAFGVNLTRPASGGGGPIG